MSNSQQVLDHENKYRYGVLIGNQQEERFGHDLLNKEVTFEFRIQNRILYHRTRKFIALDQDSTNFQMII